MRIIGKLDIKQTQLIKSIRYDGVKTRRCKKYLDKYINYYLDEIIILNCTGSL